MNIGILVPLPQELSSLTSLPVEPNHCLAITENMTVCLSGVGRKQTRLGFTKLLQQPIDLVISWGSAAGLSSAVQAGDLLVPEFIKVGNKMIATDQDFNQKLIAHVPDDLKLNQDPMTECKDILVTPRNKADLYVATQCVAADMESGALAQMAEKNKIPFSIVRSVVDEASLKLPDALLKGLRKGVFDLPTFIFFALLRPKDWAVISKLMSNFKKVKKTLIIASEIIKTNSNTWM